MRGTKAKRLRRQAYGEGNAMPRGQHHDYKDLSSGKTFRFGGVEIGINRFTKKGQYPHQGKLIFPGYCGLGTILIISARRLYKNLKKGIPVQIIREGAAA